MTGFQPHTAWWECAHAIHQVVFQSRNTPALANMPGTQGVQFYAFGFMYERTIGMGLPIREDATLTELTDAGIKVCSAKSQAALLEQLGSEYTKLGQKERELGMLCFDLAYIFTLLHSVMRFDFKERPVRFLSSMDDMDVSWALGAALNSVDPSGQPIVPPNVDPTASEEERALQMPQRDLMCPGCTGGSQRLPADAAHGAVYMWLWVATLASVTVWNMYQDYHHRIIMLTPLRRCASSKDAPPKRAPSLPNLQSHAHQVARFHDHVMDRESTMGRRCGSRLDLSRVEEATPLITSPRSTDNDSR